MSITIEAIQLGAKQVKKITFSNQSGMVIECLNLGGIITKIMVPDRSGNLENVVLAYKNLEDYLVNPAFFGALVGRTAGRIYKGHATIGNHTYQLTPSQGDHTLHGGLEGFDKKLWNVESFHTSDSAGVHLSSFSPDGEEGYPGNLKVQVTYTLTENNIFEINYEAQCDQDTLVNLTNHSYFNLSGYEKENITNHILQVRSDQVAALDNTNIPTGQLLNIKAHPIFDFNTPRSLGTHIDDAFMAPQRGYDHPWILTSDIKPCASLYHEATGRLMVVSTNQPALVLYTMNFADPLILENDTLASPRRAICFETQNLPIGYNECFKEGSLLKKGEPYKASTQFKFCIK
ncbi:MAG: aldose epimerase family protein [Niameybacter sp.]